MLSIFRASFCLNMLFIFCCSCGAISNAKKANEPLHNGKQDRPTLVFLVTEDVNNYEAHKTIPAFVEKLRAHNNYDAHVLLGSGANNAYEFEDVDIISKADLLVVFSRRIALPRTQMKEIKKYLDAGKPLIGIRTANHAFTVLEKVEPGYEDWPDFVPAVLGCQNRGYGPVGPGIDIRIVPEQATHPILRNVANNWHSEGNVYKAKPLLDEEAKILLTGQSDNLNEPVAWTRSFGQSKIFYTSLGYQKDFQSAPFNTLLMNAIQWALTEE